MSIFPGTFVCFPPQDTPSMYTEYLHCLLYLLSSFQLNSLVLFSSLCSIPWVVSGSVYSVSLLPSWVFISVMFFYLPFLPLSFDRSYSWFSLKTTSVTWGHYYSSVCFSSAFLLVPFFDFLSVASLRSSHVGSSLFIEHL